MNSSLVCPGAMLILICIGNASAQDRPLPRSWEERIQREVDEKGRVLRASSAAEGSGRFSAVMEWYTRSWTVLVATSLPIDWFLDRQVLQPLRKRGFVPDYITEVTPVPDAADLTLLRLSYAPAYKPESIFKGKALNFEYGQSSDFVHNDRTFTLVRTVSEPGAKTTAELFSRRRVKTAEGGTMCQLFVFELYEFNPISADWILTKKDYYFAPDGEEE